MIVTMRLALALFVALLFIPSPARAEWREASTDHFLIYGDLSEAQIRNYSERLERFDRALRIVTLLPDASEGGGNRVTVYFVSDVDEVRQLYGGRNTGVGAFYMPSAQGSFAITPRSSGRMSDYGISAMDLLFHEYTHHILMSGAGEYYPRWVSEGMAEFFMTAQQRGDGSMVIGTPNLARASSVMDMSRLPVRDLLSDGRNLNRQDREQVYSRGWLLIHYLLLGNERPNQFADYIRLVTAGTSSLQAGERAFGNLARLDLDLDSYRRRRALPAVPLAAGQLTTGNIAIRLLRPGEAAMMPTRIRSARGVDATTAPLLVPEARRVAAAHPNDPWVQRALAEVEFDAANSNEAEAAADRAIAIDPNQVMALVYKGRVRIRRAAATQSATPEVWREARSWFVRANRIDPNYALPLVLYYDSFVRAGQQPSANAVTGLLRAAHLVPQDPSLRIRVARQMVRQNNMPAARLAVAPIAHNPHVGPQNPAVEVLRLIDSGADSAAVLAAMDTAEWNEVGVE